MNAMNSNQECKRNVVNKYSCLTVTEKVVADFFIKNVYDMDFCSKKIADMLFVSESTLSRFAKKCGYQGYREFIYHYKCGTMVKGEENSEKGKMPDGKELVTQTIIMNYIMSLQENRKAIDEQQVRRIARWLNGVSTIYMVATRQCLPAIRTMQIYFIQMGFNVKIVDKSGLYQINQKMDTSANLLLFTELGEKKQDGIKNMIWNKPINQKTILITDHFMDKNGSRFDEILYIADFVAGSGNILSQFPIVLLMDVLCMYYRQYTPINTK